MDRPLVYDDPASPQQMAHDGRLAGRRLQLLEHAARLATRPAPALTWDALTRETPKPDVEVDEAAVRLGSRLYAD